MPLPQAAQIRAEVRAAARASGQSTSKAMGFRIRDTGDLKRLNKQLLELADGKEVRAELRTGLRNVLRPVVPEVRAAYRAGPSRGHASASKARQQQPDLRAVLAKATRVEVKTAGRQAGARIRVDGRKMPPGMGRVPRYYEGTVARWKHPVFGRGDVSTWVVQRGRPTFYPVVRRHEAQARRAVEQVVSQIKAKLERAL